MGQLQACLHKKRPRVLALETNDHRNTAMRWFAYTCPAWHTASPCTQNLDPGKGVSVTASWGCMPQAAFRGAPSTADMQDGVNTVHQEKPC